MYKNLSIQMVATLAKLTRLKEDEGVLLALHPDFILIVRPGMGKTEREDAADALLAAAEGLSLPVMEDPMDDEDSETGTACVSPQTCWNLRVSLAWMT